MKLNKSDRFILEYGYIFVGMIIGYILVCTLRAILQFVNV